MGESFKEKLKGISFPRKLGATERQMVADESDGVVRGFHDIHWDGRQDAHVTPKTVNNTARFDTDKEK
jgi:hypothetical protein